MDEKKNTSAARESEQNIHPLLLAREVVKKLWLVIAFAVIAACCTYIVASVTYTPQYQTNTTFVVSMKESGSSVYSNLAAAKNIATSFSEIIDSDVMKKKVAAQLGVDSLSGDISATAIEETNLIEMTVTASTPRDAYMMTRAVLDNYGDLADKTLTSVTMDVLRYPTVPNAPTNASDAVRMMKIAALVTALLVVAVLCMKAYFRDTIKVSEDVEAKLDTKLLATVYHERKYKTPGERFGKSKKGILLTNPTTGFAFAETFRKLRTRVDYHMRRENVKVIMVTSLLENEGKSTVAANLALAMNRKRKNVILIDGDMKKPALHKIMNYQGKKYASIVDYLDGKAKLKDTLISDRGYQMGLILGKKGTERSTELASGTAMRRLINEARQNVDCVIIDTPPMSVSPDAECVAEYADAAILVVRQDTAAVQMLNDAIDSLNDSCGKVMGCVFNNVKSADLNDRYSYGSSGKYGYVGRGNGSKYSYGSRRKPDDGGKENGDE